MTSSTYENAVRAGTMAATRLHVQLGTQEKIGKNIGCIDVFNAIFAVGPPLLLRPLQGLLGAYLNIPFPGILVTTQRPMSIQRFTGAHELGHFIMGHEPSLDDESILRREPLQQSTSEDFQEVEADAFAVNFIMPKWLIIQNCRQQGWKADDLSKPSIVYQLSLRLGASYEATCWTLQRHSIISATAARGLVTVAPREMKIALLDGYAPPDYRGDVWLLTEKDAGSRIDGSRNDLFVLRFEEHSGGGYIWNIDQLKASGFAIVRDGQEAIDENGIGNSVTRRVTASNEFARQGVVSLKEYRPWLPDELLNQFTVAYDLSGPEEEGMSRAERRNLIEAA